MRSRRIALIIFAAAFVFTAAAAAADLKFEISLDRERLAIGERAQLGLSFRGTQSMPAPDISNIDGLEVRYIGPSTMMTVINGQVSSSVTHMYSIQPLRIGKFQIGPFNFKYKGDNYSSNMVMLEVTAERAITQRPAAPAAAQRAAEKLDLDDRVFVTLNLDKPTAYVNELIPVTVKLYVNRMNVSDIQLPAFSQEGFSKVEFKEPKQYRETMGGLTYEVLEFRTSLYATRPGDYKVGPAKIKCNVVVRKSAGGGGMPDDMFASDPAFRDSFFDDFMARYEKEPVELKSDEVRLIVSALPAENRPKDFSGAVGDYQFIFSASPVKVKTGDPITVRMTINGNGNFNTVLSPSIAVPEGFKAYEPEVKTKENSKDFTQVLIPESEKITQIPAVSFGYFDPVAKEYKTITQGPLAIQVEKSKDELPTKVVGPAPESERRQEKEPVNDIIYVKDAPGKWSLRDNRVYTGTVFRLLIALPLLLLSVVYVVAARINRMKHDSAYAYRMAAYKTAKGGMRALKRKIRPGGSKIFYETLFNTMQEYFGNRLRMPAGGVTIDIVTDAMSRLDMDAATITKIRNLFSVCDQARFAFLDFDADRMKDDFMDLDAIVRHLERLQI